jgi:chemotaxis protein CheD
LSTAVEQILTVGLGEIHVSADEETLLMALGLGSCVGIAVYDPQERVGGMAHVVLPAPLNDGGMHSNKFATVAVPTLLSRVEGLGARRRRLICKIVGGAEMLATSTLRHNFRIGERNVEAVTAALQQEGIPLQAQDCGGKNGRSFRLAITSGRVAVKRLGKDWQEL